jgi:hypothetical protein
MYGRVLTRGPYHERAPVSPALEVGHDAVDDVGFRCEEIYSVHVPLHFAPVVDALDVCNWSGEVVQGNGGGTHL